MQFVFGSGHSGYSILYKSGLEWDEAESIRNMIDLSSNDCPEAVGFLPFGINNNRSLFFKVSKDTDYHRSTYYIQAFCNSEKEIPKTITSAEYIRNSFTEYDNGITACFLDQKGFNLIRENNSDFIKDLDEYDPFNRAYSRLRNVSETVITDSEMLISLLTELYAGRGIMIGVSDESFSTEYALGIIKYIFKFLPPSLKKECSYLIGSNEGSMFKIRVLKESLVVDKYSCFMPFKDICPTSITNARDLAIKEAVSNIVRLGEQSTSSIKSWFASYETFTYGVGGRYSSARFLDFYDCYYKIINGDADAAEKLLDSVLKDLSLEILDVSLCFEFCDRIKGLIISKYGTDHDFGFKISSVEEMFNPNELIKVNLIPLKKICFMSSTDEEAHRVFQKAFVKFMSTVSYNKKIYETITSFTKNGNSYQRKTQKQPYKEMFFNAYEYTYSEYLFKLSLNLSYIVKDIKMVISCILDKNEIYIINTEIFQNYVRNKVKTVFDKNSKTTYSYIRYERITKLISDYIEIMVAEHNVKYPKKGSESEELSRFRDVTQIRIGDDSNYGFDYDFSEIDVESCDSYEDATEVILNALSNPYIAESVLINGILAYINGYCRQIETDEKSEVMITISKNEELFVKVFTAFNFNYSVFEIISRYGSVVEILRVLLGHVDKDCKCFALNGKCSRLIEVNLYDTLYYKLINVVLESREKESICEITSQMIDFANNELSHEDIFKNMVNTVIDVLNKTRNNDRQLTLFKKNKSHKLVIVLITVVVAIVILCGSFLLFAKDTDSLDEDYKSDSIEESGLNDLIDMGLLDVDRDNLRE